MYEGLKPSDKYEKMLDYRYALGLGDMGGASLWAEKGGLVTVSVLPPRWPARYDQWWECKFIAEGIIDQGEQLAGM